MTNDNELPNSLQQRFNELNAGIPDYPLPDAALTDTLSRGICPDCGSRGFVIGPMAGKSINIECADAGCRRRFNATFFSGDCVMAQRIERTSTWPSEPRSRADIGISQTMAADQMLAESIRAYRRARQWLIIGSVLLVLSAFLFAARFLL